MSQPPRTLLIPAVLASALTLGRAAGPSAGPASEPAPSAAGAFPSDLVDRCSRGSLDLDAMIGKFSRELQSGLFDSKRPYSEQLAGYAMCKAAAANGASGCRLARLAGFDEQECLKERRWDALIVSALRGGDAARQCAALLGNAPRRGRPVPETCDFLIAALKSKEGAASFCPKAVSGGFFSDNIVRCQADMAFVSGRPDSCVQTPDKRPNYFRCRRLAALVGALRPGGACQDLPVCAALTSGDAEACGRLRGVTIRAICSDLSGFLGVQTEPTGESTQSRVAKEKKINEEQTRKLFKQGQEQAGEPLKQVAARKVQETENKRKFEEARHPSGHQFDKDSPMQVLPPDVEQKMKEIEEEGARRNSGSP